MALSQRQDLRQSQSLVMTPQLQQAIKLLQFSNNELQNMQLVNFRSVSKKITFGECVSYSNISSQNIPSFHQCIR